MTDRLGCWKALLPGERRFFLQSTLLLPWVILWLHLVEMRHVQAALARSFDLPRKDRDSNLTPISPRSMERLALLCEAAGRMIPGASCLACSLTTWALLRRKGCLTELRIGVRKGNGGFQAHAWIEISGQPLIAVPDDDEAFTAFNYTFGFPTPSWPQGTQFG